MFSLTQIERNDILSAIDLGWAKPVTAASFVGDNVENSFFILDSKIYLIQWIPSSTVTYYYEVTGEDKEIFLDYYKLREVASAQ